MPVVLPHHYGNNHNVKTSPSSLGRFQIMSKVILSLNSQHLVVCHVSLLNPFTLEGYGLLLTFSFSLP